MAGEAQVLSSMGKDSSTRGCAISSHNGNIKFKDCLRRHQFDDKKFRRLWIALGPKAQSGQVSYSDPWGDMDELIDIFSKDNGLAESLVASAISFGQLNRRDKVEWRRLLTVELWHSGIIQRYAPGATIEEAYSFFCDDLMSTDPYLEAYLGRSPYERADFLRSLWWTNYPAFRWLLDLVITRSSAPPMSELQIRSLVRRNSGALPIDTMIVNAWYNVNKWG